MIYTDQKIKEVENAVINFFAIIVFCPSNLFSADNTNKITVNIGEGTITIKNIFGHFAEHLGNCIYEGFILKQLILYNQYLTTIFFTYFVCFVSHYQN